MSAPAAGGARRRAVGNPAAGRAAAGRARLAVVLPPIVAGIALLLLWEAFVTIGDIRPFLLPKPSAIAAQITSNTDDIVDAARATGANALVGLLVGSVIALAAAVVAARSRIADGLLAPLAAAMNAVPIIALAPLFNTMFSSISTVPRRMVVAVVVFSPLFVNTVRGLRQVSPVHRELLDSYAASPWALTRTVRLPGALPFVFTGFRLASSLAVIAAVVAEYFGGLQDGLGSRITSAASNSAYPRAWAFVVAACVLGLACYVVMLAVERLAMPWRSRR
jgi:NitT/TauT family transport system permease protein